MLSAAIFIAGEMAGSGVLALPRAIVDAGNFETFIAVILKCVLVTNESTYSYEIIITNICFSSPDFISCVSVNFLTYSC